MITISEPKKLKVIFWHALSAVVLSFGTLASIVTFPTAAQAASSLPCDIYGSAGTPCVGAFSTVRALYSGYNGPLYQVQRASDGAKTDIGLLSTGGYANAAAQDSFCSATTCTISEIYDQSPEHNNLTVAPGGAFAGPGPNGSDLPAPANALAVMAGGHQVYGVEISPGMGYRIDHTNGVAVNGEPESAYMVTSATHVNGGCCFDFGNAETSNTDTGNGHMDAINFGTECWFSPCYGNGPWVQADMENGLFQSDAGYSQNSSDTGAGTMPFVTAMLENNGQNFMALMQGNAQSGNLTTEYSGPEPNINGGGYSPMHQEGSILLGIGGDNSHSSAGSFFEGVMTYGVPSSSAVNAVQANIVSVGYGGPVSTVGTLTPGAEVSLEATSPCCNGYYIRHSNGQAEISAISSSSDTTSKQDASWVVRPGLANTSCVSFESLNYPGDYLRHQNFVLYRQPDDGTAGFQQDATFCPKPGNSGTGTSFQSVNYPTKYIRHYDYNVYIASDGGSNAWDATNLWPQDTSFLVTNPWANGTGPGPSSGGGGSSFPSGYHTLVVANNSLCLDNYGFTSNAGAAIDQWACNSQTNQQFQFVPTSGGYGELQVENSGQDVTVLNGSTAQGTPDIVQEPVNGNSASQWLPQQQSDGSWQFTNLNSGLCLDVYGANSTQGQQLDQWPCKNAPGSNQDFFAK